MSDLPPSLLGTEAAEQAPRAPVSLHFWNTHLKWSPALSGEAWDTEEECQVQQAVPA